MSRTYASQEKAICLYCGMLTRLRNNGTLNKHGYTQARIELPTRSNPCPGSGKLPKSAEPEPEPEPLKPPEPPPRPKRVPRKKKKKKKKPKQAPRKKKSKAKKRR